MSDTAAVSNTPSNITSNIPNEVPINENPTNTPAPIPQQAPEKPQAEARKEAIQRAFERADKGKGNRVEASRPTPRPAEARAGHNQPPEETPSEGIDLKKRPADQPRGNRGQFAPREAVNSDERSSAASVGQRDQNQPAAQRPYSSPLPEGTPYREPPPRMAEHAKRDWHTAPESVRGEIYRMHQEFDGAYRQYRQAAEAFQPIAKYHQMAQSQGTTLERALANYVGMENKLRADVVGGLDVIVNNLNLTAPNGQRLGLRDIAYHVLSQSPEQLKQLQQGNIQNAQSSRLGALHDEITGLKQALNQMHTQQQFNYTRSAVDQFADTHPRFDELGEVIEYELRLGHDLETAYQRAIRLSPQTTPAAQTRSTPPSAQTRPIDRSIHGSPAVTSSNGAARRSGPPPSRRDAIRNAISRVNGSM